MCQKSRLLPRPNRPRPESETMRLRRLTTLHYALAASVAAHALLLAVRFVDPIQLERVFRDTPLEVILVNARSKQAAPAKPQAIAQANLAGGGDAATGRATSPLPPALLQETGDAADTQVQKLSALQEQQNLLLANARAALAAMPAADPSRPASDPQSRALEDRRRQMTRLLAEIERRIAEENARPRKRFISPATREEVYALYYDGLRRRIEERGTRNFPEVAGRKLYGELTLMITVNNDGRVLATEVVRGSGTLDLDRRAMAIAQAAGPFGRFSEGMRRQADQIAVVSRFRFGRDETLQADMVAR